MAIVTGSMLDFQLLAFVKPGARLVFIPSSSAVSGNAFLFPDPIYVYPDTLGAWSQNFAVADGTAPDWWYSIRAEWPIDDGTDTWIGADFPAWKLRVPPDGGVFGDLIDRPLGSGEVWVSTDDIHNPAGSQRGDFVFNPTTNDLFQIA